MLHVKLICIIGSLLLGHVITAENSTSFPLTPVYSTEYKIVETQLAGLLLNLMNNYPYNTLIKSADVLNFLHFRMLNSSGSLLEVNFEKLISASNASVNEIRSVLTDYVPPRKITNLRKIVEGFNIDFDEYQEYVMVNDDVRLLKLLKTGTYTNDTVQHALGILAKTEREVMDIILPIFFEELAKLPLQEILDTFGKELMNVLSDADFTLVTASQNPVFHLMLKNFTDNLNSEIIWSTAISTNELVTILGASEKIQLFTEYVDVYIRNVENDTIFYKGSISRSDTFSIIEIEETLDSFINKTTSYSIDIKDCYYVTQSTLENINNITWKSTDDILFENNLILTENAEEVVQNFGSPLICNDLLYGFLVDQNETTLIYYSFKEVDSNEPTTSGSISIFEPTQSEYFEGISSAGKLCISIVYVIAIQSIMFIKM